MLYDLLGLAPATFNTSKVGWVNTNRPGVVAPAVVAITSPSAGTDYLLVGNLPQFQITAALTLAAWVRFDLTLTNAPIIAKWGATPGYLLLVDSTTSNKFNFTIRIGAANKTVISTSTYNSTGWHRVVGTYDGATVTLYVDGLSTGTPVSTSGAITNPSDSLVFGNYSASGTSGTAFAGGMDDIVVANRAWSQSEVTEDYEESRLGYPNLLNRVPMILNTTIQKNPPTPYYYSNLACGGSM